MAIKKKVTPKVVEEVTLGADVSKTNNLGNYESSKFNVYAGYKRTVLPGETVDEAFDKVAETIEKQLRAKYKQFKEVSKNLT